MPCIVETVVYELPELPRNARERARAWYRDTCLDWDWYDAVFKDFQTVCGLLGVTLRTRAVRLIGGGTREAPNLWFSGFAHQGAGASFDAAYRHAKAASRAIRSYAPKDGCTPSPTISSADNGETSTSSAPASASPDATTTSTA